MSPSPRKPRPAGRPPASVLTPEKIASAALHLISREGNFTMSKLAQQLEVAPSSLYNHLSSRDQVLAAISDHIAQGIDTSALTLAAQQLDLRASEPQQVRRTWIQATSHWARSYRRAFSLTPAVVTTLAITPVRQAPATLAMYENVTQAFLLFGLSHRQALLTIEALEAFLLGAALDTQAPADIFNPSPHQQEHPAIWAAYQELGPTPQDEAFELGLGALLEGLACQLQGPKPSEAPKARGTTPSFTGT